MGSANLRKISTVISLVMSKFTIGNRANISAGEHNTRVAVITYDHVARIVANFTDINSLGDLSAVLNKIQVSNTADANLYDAFEQQVKCTEPYFTNGSCLVPTADMDIDRPTAYVVFASNLDSRYAQCMVLAGGDEPEWGMPDNYTELCTSDGLTPLAILSQDEENFVQTIWNNTWFYEPPYYIGLHQDSKGNWVWYDDNMKEFSSSYSNWAPGYPKNLGKCAVAAFAGVSSDPDESHFVWKDADCDPEYSLYGLALCQRGACDAESVACGLVNLPNINLTLVEMKKKMAMYGSKLKEINCMLTMLFMIISLVNL
uniref:C-type lectin domain-containing protein n=1 Tax=Acrobeloides nanus TaxID=290746 RepID=A0A914CNI9_9BILA